MFTTRDNSHDLVSLSNIPSSGYGGGGGGFLAYWIILICEVIPTQTDEPNSFDVWWNIFNGIHAVMGYRTEMWINDDVMGGIGISIGLVGFRANLHHLGSVLSLQPMHMMMVIPITTAIVILMNLWGCASAVVVCGHSDDTANNIQNH